MSEVDWQMLGRTVLRLEKQQQEDIQQVRESIAELGEKVGEMESELAEIHKDWKEGV